MSRGPAPVFEAGTDASPGLEDFGHRLMIGKFSLVVVRAGFRYREDPPPPGLGEFVACTWHSEVVSPFAHRLRIVPDGCTEIVYSQERGVLVYGPGTEWSDVLLPPRSRHCGVRLRPAAASAALRLTMTELGGQVVSADELDGARAWNRSSADDWLAATVEVLAERVRRRPLDWAVARAVEILTDRPTESMGQVAREAAVSERQLRRSFAREVGLPPASYRRIARMRRAVAAAAGSDLCGWSRIANDLGFSDQSHLVREMRSLTGMRPTEMVS